MKEQIERTIILKMQILIILRKMKMNSRERVIKAVEFKEPDSNGRTWFFGTPEKHELNAWRILDKNRSLNGNKDSSLFMMYHLSHIKYT
jgi:hypothetical protein